MKKYPNLLAPIPVGNLLLKNRMISTNSLPHYLQGPESFPNDQVISHLASVARNGAALVTFADWTNEEQRVQPKTDGQHFPMYDIKDPSVHNYLSQLADTVHYYNSYVSLAVQYFGPRGYYLTDQPADEYHEFEMVTMLNMTPQEKALQQYRSFNGDFGPLKGYTRQDLERMCEEIAQRVRFYQHQGFDMVTIHMAYRLTVFSQFLSPISNNRMDEFGGSLENRARFPLMVCRRIKELCGKDFPIEIQISGTEEEENGLNLEEVIAFAKMAEGLIDIFQLRAPNGDLSHPTGFNSVPGKHITESYARALKESGAKVLVEVVGGYQDPAENEAILASGNADLIGMARAFICDFDYYEKILDGRSEDITPCLRCNKCHVPTLEGPWISLCSVNPQMGIASKLDMLEHPSGISRRVAVVGGGPAGMKAALDAAARGHRVTLYEKRNVLGGQLTHADSASFKWPLRNFKNYLISQLEKSSVTVVLGHEAAPEELEKESFDVVIAALGAQPKLPPVSGTETAGIWKPIDVFGREAELGHTVVVVGGSETGTETGMYLAENGHEVTVLSRQHMLAADATPIHYVETVTAAYQRMPNFHPVVHAATVEIRDGRVTYRDQSGELHTLKADSVVACGGVEGLTEKALAFQRCAPRFFMIGDCRRPGNVQNCMRQAYAVASIL